MARRKKVASITKKRLKTKPLAYVDKKGNVRHFRRGQKKKSHSILQKKVVSAALLKKRKAKGKKGILLFVKGKSVFSVARKLRRGKRKKRRKTKGRKRKATRKSRIRKLRKKSRRCPKTRRGGGFRSAAACVSRGKGSSLASKKIYNKAVRKLRKSKKGRSLIRKRKIKMARHKGRIA
jgi:hypothetical protein